MGDVSLTSPDLGGAAVWITRAQPGAARTAEAVVAMGLTPIVEPLVETRVLAGAPADLEGVAALAFTSAAAVGIFAALHTVRDLPVFTVGDATARAARALGFGEVTSAGGDVAALDALLASKAPAGRVLAPGALRPAGRLRHAERLAVYETGTVPGPWPRAKAAIDGGSLRAVLVHSLSAGRALEAAGLASTGAEVLALSQACLAPLTASRWASLRAGLRPDEPSLLALLADAAPWQGPPTPL